VSEDGTPRKRGQQVRNFLIILGLTILVWYGFAMSEEREYTLQVKVDIAGIDQRRYAVIEADTTLPMQVVSSGFSALLVEMQNDPIVLEVNMGSAAVSRYSRYNQASGQKENHCLIGVSDLADNLKDQLASYGIKQKSVAKDSVEISFVERQQKSFRPDISDLKIGFAEGYGLYGEPTVTPEVVTLYGAAEVLEKIKEVKLAPSYIVGLNATGNYRVPLDVSWKELGDVHASTEQLSVKIPVQQFVEHQYQVPITVEGIDSLAHLRLYPDKATVNVWVAHRDIPSLSADRFSITASYQDILSGSQKLKLNLSRFPELVRIRSVEPQEVQYVIIKK
jgi:hypothetical protein